MSGLGEALRNGDELAYDNIHADWARESIARTILAWFAEVLADEGLREAVARSIGEASGYWGHGGVEGGLDDFTDAALAAVRDHLGRVGRA